MKYVLTSLALASMSVGACIASGLAQTTAPPAARADCGTGEGSRHGLSAHALAARADQYSGAITAMPADKFNYKPTPEQMTFAHLVVHIIGSNNGGCAKSADVAAPKMEEVKETDSKDKLLAAASASFDFCGDALTKMDDSKLGDSLELFGGRQGPRRPGGVGLSQRLGRSLRGRRHVSAAEWNPATDSAAEKIRRRLLSFSHSLAVRAELLFFRGRDGDSRGSVSLGASLLGTCVSILSGHCSGVKKRTMNEGAEHESF